MGSASNRVVRQDDVSFVNVVSEMLDLVTDGEAHRA